MHCGLCKELVNNSIDSIIDIIIPYSVQGLLRTMPWQRHFCIVLHNFNKTIFKIRYNILIRYIYYWNLQFLDNLIFDNTKVVFFLGIDDLSRYWLSRLVLLVFAAKDLKLFGFSIFWHWAHLMKVIPETCHGHYIIYLPSYYLTKLYLLFRTGELLILFSWALYSLLPITEQNITSGVISFDDREVKSSCLISQWTIVYLIKT